LAISGLFDGVFAVFLPSGPVAAAGGTLVQAFFQEKSSVVSMIFRTFASKFQNMDETKLSPSAPRD
jgi:hypothetical protein